MKNVLILGAGRTVPSLIDYLARLSGLDIQIRVGDISEQLANQRALGYDNVTGFSFDVTDQSQREQEVLNADLVISLLPVKFHIEVAKTCLQYGKQMLTASYITPEMAKLDTEAKDKGILLLNECGLDPGLDHMTAMAALDYIRLKKGGEVFSFNSYTGGLIAPESDNNPWHYKFTWNPRNVVLAGTETARFIRNGKYKYIPYHCVFTRLDQVQVAGYGNFEGYPNRDSLKYRELYGLENVETMIRGTLRRPGFCDAWNVLVQLGLTDDSYQLEDLPQMTYRDFINTFLYYHPTKLVEDKLCEYLNIDPNGQVMKQLTWLGIFERRPINLAQASPAVVLQHLLEQKWKLEPDDKDMIVMQHQVGYRVNGKRHKHITSLVVVGDDHHQTAMSKTVGWPLAVAAKLVLSGSLKQKGVCVPVTAEFYKPIIQELTRLGVKITREETQFDDSNP
ncbi:MAG: saccharopine dehydrogenase [Cyclobacteriaceae bacterium]|nr:MAG: saccharopine dehydrogenase [Cyclobacteriaceae bacterium]